MLVSEQAAATQSVPAGLGLAGPAAGLSRDGPGPLPRGAFPGRGANKAPVPALFRLAGGEPEPHWSRHCPCRIRQRLSLFLLIFGQRMKENVYCPSNHFFRSAVPEQELAFADGHHLVFGQLVDRVSRYNLAMMSPVHGQRSVAGQGLVDDTLIVPLKVLKDDESQAGMKGDVGSH